MTSTKPTISPIAFVFAAVLSLVAWNATLAMPATAQPAAQTASAIV